MLQQTQVDTVIPYFNRFLERFPTSKVLAEAPLQDVLKAWEGLGYYSRARNLHKAAQKIHVSFAGDLPKSFESLQDLPGIGPYTAAAIASIAFGEPVPVVDGNVLRVFCRFWGIDQDTRDPKVRDQLFDRLTPFIAQANPSVFNQSMMELGALVCKPSQPLCDVCPMQKWCVAYTQNRVLELPYRSKAAATPHYEIAVGIIWKLGKILIGRRKESGMLGGLWEFPGGKQKPGEDLAHTVVREVKEETGLDIIVGARIAIVNHAYTHFKITLSAFHCEYIAGEAQPLSADEVRWVLPDELKDYPFPTANKKVIERLVWTQDSRQMNN